MVVDVNIKSKTFGLSLSTTVKD